MRAANTANLRTQAAERENIKSEFKRDELEFAALHSVLLYLLPEKRQCTEGSPLQDVRHAKGGKGVERRLQERLRSQESVYMFSNVISFTLFPS